jgi:NAD(P)-dependent dehydrogenase (short-subunit alcohol dehydrogenase family)
MLAPGFTTWRRAILLRCQRPAPSLPQAVIHAAGMMAAAPLGQLESDVSTRCGNCTQACEALFNHFAPEWQQADGLWRLAAEPRGAAGRSQYVATKAAMVGMVRSWAAELAPRDYRQRGRAGRRKRRCSAHRGEKPRRRNARRSDV